MIIPESEWVIPTPDDIIAARQDDILRRIHSLHKIYNSIFKPWRSRIHLSLPILNSCVESYYLDIHRLKAFHSETKWADRHKQSGFIMKWVCQLRPVQLTGYLRTLPADDRKILLMANEFFAFFAGLNYLTLDKRALSDNLVKNFIYSLRYRPISAELLATQAYLLERAASKETP